MIYSYLSGLGAKEQVSNFMTFHLAFLPHWLLLHRQNHCEGFTSCNPHYELRDQENNHEVILQTLYYRIDLSQDSHLLLVLHLLSLL